MTVKHPTLNISVFVSSSVGDFETTGQIRVSCVFVLDTHQRHDQTPSQSMFLFSHGVHTSVFSIPVKEITELLELETRIFLRFTYYTEICTRFDQIAKKRSPLNVFCHQKYGKSSCFKNWLRSGIRSISFRF